MSAICLLRDTYFNTTYDKCESYIDDGFTIQLFPYKDIYKKPLV